MILLWIFSGFFFFWKAISILLVVIFLFINDSVFFFGGNSLCSIPYVSFFLLVILFTIGQLTLSRPQVTFMQTVIVFLVIVSIKLSCLTLLSSSMESSFITTSSMAGGSVTISSMSFVRGLLRGGNATNEHRSVNNILLSAYLSQFLPWWRSLAWPKKPLSRRIVLFRRRSSWFKPLAETYVVGLSLWLKPMMRRRSVRRRRGRRRKSYIETFP